jgi:signal peptidase I
LIAGGIACCVGGVWNWSLFLIGAGSFVVALVYWLVLRWVDRHGDWSPRRGGRFHLLWTSILLVVLGGVAVFAVLRLIVFDFYTAPQDGMYPGVPAGTRFVALRCPYRNVSQVERGDIVVFSRRDRGDAGIYIWRVVGLPGDLIQIVGDNIIVNGHALKHDKVRTDRDSIIFRETNGTAEYEIAYKEKLQKRALPKPVVKVPPNHVFVLADNRQGAHDSSEFGSIPFEAIVAKKW